MPDPAGLYIYVCIQIYLCELCVQSKYEEASQVANEAVGSIRTVVSFCAEEKVMKMYEMKCGETIKRGIKLGILRGFGVGFGNLAYHCTNSFCFYVGAVFATRGEATFEQVFEVLN